MADAAAVAKVVVPTVEINGAALDGVTISDIRVELSMGVPSQAVVRLSDTFDGVSKSVLDSLSAKVGDALAVNVKPDNTRDVEIFQGIILSIGWTQMPSGRSPTQHEVVITAVDKRHGLTHGREPKTHLNKSYGDVISELLSETGLSASVASTDLLGARHEYLMVTDNAFDWISAVVAKSGHVWYQDGTTVKVTDPDTTAGEVSVSPDRLLRFSTEFRAGAGDKSLKVRSQDPLTLAAITADQTMANTTPSSTATLHSSGMKDANANVGKDLSVTGHIAQTAAEATGLGKGLGRQLAAEQVVARGTFDGVCTDVAPGKKITVTDAPAKIGGDYILSSVTHVINRAGSNTSFTTGGLQRRSLVDLLGTPAGTAPPFGSAPVFGEVTSVDDPEKMGRAKVKFPSLSATDESWWARVVSAGAGPSKGLQMLPHVGDWVLVVFEQGDHRRPVIVGGTWVTGQELPDGELTSAATKGWALKTRDGAKIELRDSDADAPVDTILLETKGAKSKVSLSEEMLTIETSGIDIEIKTAGGSMVIADNGDITINGNNITISADADVKISSGSNLEVDAGSNGTVKSAANMKVESGAMMDVKAGGIANIKGSMVNVN